MRRCPVMAIPPFEASETIPSGSSARARRPREPEARGAHSAESDGDQERDAIAPREIVDEAPEPRRDATPDAVAHAEDPIDGAEAPPLEEQRRDRRADSAA